MQTAWVLVSNDRWMVPGTTRCTRGAVIRSMLQDYHSLRTRKEYSGCSDAQFWHKLRRRYMWSVCKIEMRLVK